MTEHSREINIPRRYSGPPGSANGGWAAGSLARLLDGAAPSTTPRTVVVQLRRPPPLEATMPVTTDHEWLVAEDPREPGAVVLRAREEAQHPPEPVAAVDLETARTASIRYPGHTAHPFSSCFVCGTDRKEGDGLRIFPGKVSPDDSHDQRVATTWTPAPEFAEAGHEDEAGIPATWAALDCIGGWAGHIEEHAMVLASITVHLLGRPRIGLEHVLVAEPRGDEGRKVFTGVSLYEPDGTLIAAASHLWITVDPATFGTAQ